MNEAWIFVSIGDAGGDQGLVDLDKVIGMADSNNHSIPNPDELEEAVSNLMAAGLVEANGVETRLTEAGGKAGAKENARHVGHIQRFLDLDRQWRSRGYPAPVAKSWFLDEETWRQAWDAYRR